MDNYMGDLTDIVRARGTGGSQEPVPAGKWGQFPADSNGLASMTNNSSSSIEDNFGDPFSDLRDPLLHGLDVPNSVFFGGSGLVGADGEVFVPGMMNRQQQPPNMYTRMLQMTGDPTTAKLSIGEQPVLAGAMMKEIKVSPMASLGHRSDVSIRVDKSKGCLVESTGTMQISSPTNSGIKRRKSQAKKVVCIPAPAAVNSRASGEVVPSDLWAWRKYGQKPIKGSPYPRGYYRCSSSKGCSARKQVERSRTDPNMLVITYTSEHNHPWPTQRNALAGSTRSQPSKSNNGGATPKTSHSPPLQKSSTTAKEHKEIDSSSLTTLNAGGSSATSASIKEEAEDFQRHTEMEMDDGHEFSADFSHSYRPSEPDEANRGDDFFADLGEISGDDPLNLLFSQGFSGDGQKEARGLDPFSIFDWSSIEDQNTTYNEVKRDVFTTRP